MAAAKTGKAIDGPSLLGKDAMGSIARWSTITTGRCEQSWAPSDGGACGDGEVVGVVVVTGGSVVTTGEAGTVATGWAGCAGGTGAGRGLGAGVVTTTGPGVATTIGSVGLPIPTPLTARTAIR